MITISICMIVKNEDKNLNKILKCAKNFSDEIIIVDTGSTDNTKTVAKNYTDKIYDFEWCNDFSAARNFSFSKATMDYIMWLDADDTLNEEDITKIIELKENMDLNIDVVLMKYVLGLDDHKHITNAFYRERILKRSKNFKWVGSIHEYIDVNGILLQTDICIIHSPKNEVSDRNLKIIEKIINNSDKATSRDYYYYAAELHNNAQYKKAFEYFLKFINSENPSSQYMSDACIHLATYYMNNKESIEALKILIHSMEYGIIKPEILCYIGNIYKELKEYEKAITWYELIFKILIPKFDLEIHSYDLGGFIPCIDLCFCYSQIGNYEKAIEYNNLAAKFKPGNPIIAYNNQQFREAGIL